MTGKQFISGLFGLVLCFLFIKIYQHNRLIQAEYEFQRIERQCDQLIKLCNKEQIRLAKLKDPTVLKKRAEVLGFIPLDPQQLVFITHTTADQGVAIA